MSEKTPVRAYRNVFEMLVDSQYDTKRFLVNVGTVELNAFGLTQRGTVIVKFRLSNGTLLTENRNVFNNQL